MPRGKRTENPPLPLGHNGPPADEPMSEAATAELFLQHRDAYSKALASKKATAAKFLKICKGARAELGKHVVEDIKTALLLEEEGGEGALASEIARKLRVAAWLKLPIGDQADMFDHHDLEVAVGTGAFPDAPAAPK